MKASEILRARAELLKDAAAMYAAPYGLNGKTPDELHDEAGHRADFVRGCVATCLLVAESNITQAERLEKQETKGN